MEKSVWDKAAKETKKSPLGLGQVLPPCERCPESLRPKMGCQRFGNSFIALKPFRLRKEKTPTREGSILFCPRSFDQPLLEQAVFECINVIEAAGGLYPAFGKAVYSQPARRVDFYTEVLQARDNYLSEQGD